MILKNDFAKIAFFKPMQNFPKNYIAINIMYAYIWNRNIRLPFKIFFSQKNPIFSWIPETEIVQLSIDPLLR